ncbi:MerR family transcriptional regulator [Nocardiopsis akebiae]|uniref:MerR family transcriptional regulator n=1 Tax=Nocardiopsis akebiae TaxID=2831968 RepID=UPI00308406A4
MRGLERAARWPPRPGFPASASASARTRIGPGGIRHYGHGQLLRLQRILVMRELGMGLSEIARVLDEPGDRAGAHALRPPGTAPQRTSGETSSTVRSREATRSNCGPVRGSS